MKGLFCSYGRNEDYATDEAYRNIVKQKAIVAGGLMVLGLITIAFEMIMMIGFEVAIDDYMLGFLTGIGAGLFCAGGALLIKRMRMLKNEKRLKAARIEESDERNRSISGAAHRVSAAVLLIAMYVVMIVSLFFMRELVQVMSMLICLYLLAYVVSYKILQRKM